MRRFALLTACLVTFLPAVSHAQAPRVAQERSVLVPTRTYQSSEERVAQRLQREEVPLLAQEPELAPTPAFAPQPAPPKLPAAGISTRRARSPVVQGRVLAPETEQVEDSPAAVATPMPMPEPVVPPVPEPRMVSAPEREPAATAASPTVPSASLPAEPAARLPANPTQTQSSAPTTGSELSTKPESDLMLTTSGTALRVDAMGPRSITIGRPASYRVRLQNLTDIDGKDIAVRVELPTWVDVIGGRATVGQAQRVADENATTTLLTWNVSQISARSEEFLDLQLIPRKSTPFDVKVEWTAQPRKAQARVMVQSPQLAIQIVGSREVMFGAKSKYLVHITNPGNGDAENVTLHVSSGDGIQSKEFGRLGAGARETVELELIAREAGELVIEAAAVADGDLTAESALPVRIRRAKLEMQFTGPGERFAGQDAVYSIVVNNTGDAPATSLVAQVTLPQGAEYLGGVSAANVSNGRLQWRMPDLAPGKQMKYQFQITLPVPGEQRLAAQAASNNELMAHGTTATKVVAIADLKLSIDDPRGPVPTGKQVTYEMTVTNRGSRDAENVRVIAQFSNGIEPVSYDGHNARIVPGQVLFDPITTLGGGQTMVLKVVARAEKAGTHRFRATVTSNEKEVQHIAEETTRYFSRLGEAGNAAAPPQPPQPTQSPAYEANALNAVRSAAPLRTESAIETPVAGADEPIDLTPMGAVPLETSPITEPVETP